MLLHNSLSLLWTQLLMELLKEHRVPIPDTWHAHKMPKAHPQGMKPQFSSTRSTTEEGERKRWRGIMEGDAGEHGG